MKYCPKCAAPLVDELIDGVSRRVCSGPQRHYIYWNNPVPVVAALVHHEGEVILARNVRWPKHIFSSISGYLEANESPETAVAREVKEELGLETQAVHWLGHYPFKEKNQLLIGYAIMATGTVRLNHELAEIKRVSIEQLRHYDFHPLYVTAAMVADLLAAPTTFIPH